MWYNFCITIYMYSSFLIITSWFSRTCWSIFIHTKEKIQDHLDFLNQPDPEIRTLELLLFLFSLAEHASSTEEILFIFIEILFCFVCVCLFCWMCIPCRIAEHKWNQDLKYVHNNLPKSTRPKTWKQQVIFTNKTSCECMSVHVFLCTKTQLWLWWS